MKKIKDSEPDAQREIAVRLGEEASKRPASVISPCESGAEEAREERDWILVAGPRRPIGTGGEATLPAPAQARRKSSRGDLFGSAAATARMHC